jgi:NAD+ synthase/NAD+ synthase (glutamine-hydrolysing)
MKIAVAQVNVTVGDFAGNAERIRRAVDAARAGGAKLVVAPEMALSGYPAEDLWLRDDFCDQCTAELLRLAAHCTDVTVVVGYPTARAARATTPPRCLRTGRIEKVYFKQKLPNYAVFDEKRYFETGSTACVFEVDGRKIGLTICEDLWFPSRRRRPRRRGRSCCSRSTPRRSTARSRPSATSAWATA